jgi:hypothetical protein
MAVTIRRRQLQTKDTKDREQEIGEVENIFTVNHPKQIGGGVLIAASTGGGKTNAFKVIYHANISKFGSGAILFCGSPSTDQDYDYIHPLRKKEYSKRTLRKFMDIQTKRIKEDDENERPRRWMMMIFDDIGGINFKNDLELASLSTKCRHHCIVPFYLVQRINICPPICRTNCQIMFGSNLLEDDMKEFHRFAGCFKDVYEAYRTIKRLAPRYQFIMHWRNDPSGKVLRVFKFPKVLQDKY